MNSYVGRPVVTIGIAAYNGSAHIHRAIDSVLNQGYQNIELLISDDCSSDETMSICKRYAEKDNRIKYVRQDKNIGAPANYFYLFSNASKNSSYFKWLDQDDYLVGNSYIETLVDKLESGYDFAVSNVTIKNTEIKGADYCVYNTMSIFDVCVTKYDFAHASLKETAMLYYSMFNIDAVYHYMDVYFDKIKRTSFVEGVFCHSIASKLKGSYVSSEEFVYCIHGENISRTESIDNLISDYRAYIAYSVKFFILESDFDLHKKLKLTSFLLLKSMYYLIVRLIFSKLKRNFLS